MRTLQRLFRRWLDVYPAQPLVYICRHNGVTGVVRAEDYDTELRRMRRQFRKQGWPSGVTRPQVYPVFLFSDMTRGKRSFCVGNIAELNGLLLDCAVEPRDFELPPLNAPGSTPYGYYGAFEEIGRENTRHRLWTLDQACTYLHGTKIYSYNFE